VKKSARGPFTCSQMDSEFGFGRGRPIRRFGLPKGDGVRPCDDAIQSLHNSAFVSDHVVSSCPYDFPAAVASAFFDESRALASPPIGSIGGAKQDVPNAYRTVPAVTPEQTVAALAHLRSCRVCFFETRGINFGLAGSGVNFVRLPTCITFAARRLLAVPADIFTDDEQIVESTLSRVRHTPRLYRSAACWRFRCRYQSGRNGLHALSSVLASAPICLVHILMVQYRSVLLPRKGSRLSC